jgi:hypothetical protein
MAQGTAPSASGGIDVVKGFRIAGIVTVVLIVIQAAMAGRGFFFGGELIKRHGEVGNITFLAGLVMLGFAFSGYRQKRLDQFDFIVSVLVVLLIVAQLGLGYGGRDNRTAASLHWPNGVLITLLGAMLLGRTIPRRT